MFCRRGLKMMQQKAQHTSDSQKTMSLAALLEGKTSEDYQDEIKKAMEVIDTIHSVIERIDPEKFKTILGLMADASLFFGVASVIFGLTDPADDKVVKKLDEIKDDIHQLSNDIKKLHADMNWSDVILQYDGALKHIQLAIDLCPRDINEDNWNDDISARFKELCANQSLTKALTNVLSGFEHDEMSKNILKSLYTKTSGHIGVISDVSVGIIDLLFGGMSALVVYETLTRGRSSAEKFARATFKGRFEAMQAAISEFTEKCVNECKTNMENDLAELIKAKPASADPIFNALTSKYPFLAITTIIYDDTCGADSSKSTIRWGEGLTRLRAHMYGKYVRIFYMHRPLKPCQVSDQTIDDLGSGVSSLAKNDSLDTCEYAFDELKKLVDQQLGEDSYIAKLVYVGRQVEKNLFSADVKLNFSCKTNFPQEHFIGPTESGKYFNYYLILGAQPSQF